MYIGFDLKFILGSVVVNKVGKIKNFFKVVKMYVVCIVKGIEMEIGFVGEFIKGNLEKIFLDGEFIGIMFILVFSGVIVYGVLVVDLRR